MLFLFFIQDIKKRGIQLAEARVSTPTNLTSCSTPYLNTAFVNHPLIGLSVKTCGN